VNREGLLYFLNITIGFLDRIEENGHILFLLKSYFDDDFVEDLKNINSFLHDTKQEIETAEYVDLE
jgi:hypothetical protein